jgi:hypothetical protein
MEKIKIIFLDFDGVLNPPGGVIRGNPQDLTRPKMGPEAIANLNYIIKSTGAKVVVSSTWRRVGVNFLQAALNNNGFHGEIISTTPFVNRHHRGGEIRQWFLYTHITQEVDSFVILDDDDDMDPLMDHLVQTDPLQGLTRTDAERAIEILNRA